MAHTPEPWVVVDAEVVPGVPGKAIMGTRGTMREPIASVYSPFRDVMEDNANILGAALDLLAVCEVVAARPAEAQEMMRREGFVIDDLGDRWQKLAFTLYTYLAANATQAEAAIAIAKGEQ